MKKKKDEVIVGSVHVEVSDPDGKEIFSQNYTNPSTPTLVANITESLKKIGIDFPAPYSNAMETNLGEMEAANQAVTSQTHRTESEWGLKFEFDIPRYEGPFGKTEGGRVRFSFFKTTKK